MKDTDLAYVAVFFDGDGTVGVNWMKGAHRRRGGRYGLRVSIDQKHYPSLFDSLLEEFGGSLTPRHRMGGWRWTIASAQALSFLEEVLPYLHNKKPQVELAIKFQRRMRHRTRLHPNELIWQEAIAEEIKRLKKAESLPMNKSLFQRARRETIQQELPFGDE